MTLNDKGSIYMTVYVLVSVKSQVVSADDCCIQQGGWYAS